MGKQGVDKHWWWVNGWLLQLLLSLMLTEYVNGLHFPDLSVNGV
jgi:hypothetical protein